MDIEIVSGFLGAGKTTFLNKYLPLLKGKTVVIENEFGDIGLDGNLISADIPIREIYAGCICCSLALDFQRGIKDIADCFKPDRIVIEPSGVGRLSDIIKACNMAKKKEMVELKVTKLITVIDIKSFEDYINEFGNFYRNQIEDAGLLFLSNLDGITVDEHQRIVSNIKKINPTSILYDGDFRKIEGEDLVELLNLTDITVDVEEEGCISAGVQLPANKVFSNLSIERFPDLTEEELEYIFSELKNSLYGYIIRVKGVVKTPQNQVLHFDYTPYFSGYESANEGSFENNKVVVIGCGLNKGLLEMLLKGQS